ncbi:hypothetical protein ACFUC1_01055 [Pedococcus sp. NPDC057267]|uniref:hypothetical protein n=1 Tax=Pedococcus sp. NPDC057267 TaxID=3346077 RepID=UPI00363AB440
MNRTRTTPQGHPSAVTTSRSRRPGYPVPAPLPGRDPRPGPDSATGATGAVADPVVRLEEIRARLAALALLLQDEPARRLADVLREVEALAQQLRRPHRGETPAVASPPAGELQAAGAPTPTGPGQLATRHGSAEPAHPPQPPAAPTTRPRPPALPGGPDYPLLPVRRAS